jgi:hypothetical protein
MSSNAIAVGREIQIQPTSVSTYTPISKPYLHQCLPKAPFCDKTLHGCHWLGTDFGSSIDTIVEQTREICD